MLWSILENSIWNQVPYENKIQGSEAMQTFKYTFYFNDFKISVVYKIIGLLVQTITHAPNHIILHIYKDN